MSDARQEHQMLLAQTGRPRLSDEQEETIREYIGDTILELEEEGESTLELPQLK